MYYSLTHSGPGKNHEVPYLRILLDEFVHGWSGFQAFDVLTGQWHTCHMVLLYAVTDTRGLEPITQGMTHPSKCACHFCEVRGVHVNGTGTTVYPYMWRNLPADSSLRAECHRVQVPMSMLSKTDCEDFVLPTADAPPFKPRTKRLLRAAAVLAENSDEPEGSKYHPSKVLHAKRRNFISMTLPYWNRAL